MCGHKDKEMELRYHEIDGQSGQILRHWIFHDIEDAQMYYALIEAEGRTLVEGAE